jgi:hypothetical protein
MKAASALFLLAMLAAAALTGCARSMPAGSSGPASPSGSSRPDTASGICPRETPLDPGPGAGAAATSAAEAAVPQRYRRPIDTTGFQVARAYPADLTSGYGPVAYGLCGSEIGQRTWVVELSFPKMLPSADLSAGQLFLSRFQDGWKVWFQYH